MLVVSSTYCKEGTRLISRYLMDTASARDSERLALTYRRDCPSRTVIEVLANKWALYVLAALRRQDDPMRFNDLRRLLEGITQKMLTQTLRALERDGLVCRTVYPTVPPRVEYALTELGVEAGRLTTAIADWSIEHAPEILISRQTFDSRTPADTTPLPAVSA
jgi:DNA-binding HxlR family transcriptional regulator